MIAAARQAWLVTNRGSGSNDPASSETLGAALEARRWEVERTVCFPAEELPSLGDLRGAGERLLVIFTGDGTVNACASALEGWEGEVLVLPGGTQNLLAKRLHGPATAEEILDRVMRGAGRAVRITGVACEAGKALADLLVGPGSSWHTVREALREGDLPGVAAKAGEAMEETTGGAGVICLEPPLGHRGGYPLLKLMPTHRGVQVDAYHANNLTEFLAQGWAMLKRDFRAGPHDRLGLLDALVVAKRDRSPVDILLDGEPRQLGAEAEFTLAEWKLNLIATEHGY